MGNTSSRDWFDPYAINTPLAGLCAVSCLFNSVPNGVLRISNVYTNVTLLVLLGCSTGCSTSLHMPLLGAQTGLAASLLFTFGAPMKIHFTSRLFPRSVHYGIGAFYTTYHAMQLQKELNYFEDAHEDGEDEVF
ncbi:conserved hypothetical protein [Leishmania mexicana MHOM/GT/2001/U1103]|uniref:Transmembrane protein n=1 Tax=Leishmania mexicana (strain MHOM/GT/2001/U1103) TaxID=929439 RepID=E9B2Z4_LEIMU|nr:conserved hypothetical protein [Leishmania mexicana MHOM/GT/2001/U1103]CBZ29608.1 conserved hypothetical protein [Leishmania mexicana MHOM/GT/2001/U1103]